MKTAEPARRLDHPQIAEIKVANRLQSFGSGTILQTFR